MSTKYQAIIGVEYDGTEEALEAIYDALDACPQVLDVAEYMSGEVDE